MNKKTDRKRLTHRFPPVISENSRILILGSFPSVKSRAADFYYMHPQNRFWPLLSMIFSDKNFESAKISTKIKTLKKHGIAIYDVIDSCFIEGSSDATIKEVVPTDIKKLLSESKIENIYLNGRTAYDLFVKFNDDLSDIAKYLPSTSPANARYGLEKLFQAWKIINNTTTN